MTLALQHSRLSSFARPSCPSDTDRERARPTPPSIFGPLFLGFTLIPFLTRPSSLPNTDSPGCVACHTNTYTDTLQSASECVSVWVGMCTCVSARAQLFTSTWARHRSTTCAKHLMMGYQEHADIKRGRHGGRDCSNAGKRLGIDGRRFDNEKLAQI